MSYTAPIEVILAPATSVRNVIQPMGDVIPLTLKSFSGQTANLLEFRTFAGVLTTAVLPNGAVSLNTNFTNTGGGFGAGDQILSIQSITPTGNTALGWNGFENFVSLFGGFNFTGSITGFNNNPTHAGTGTVNLMTGIASRCVTQAGGAVTSMVGCSSNVAITTVAATVASAVGFASQVQNQKTGAVFTKAVGYQASAPILSAGSSTVLLEGIEVSNQGSSLVTTSYGVRVLSQSGSGTTWSIVSEGGRCLLQAGAATVIPLTVQGAASQSADNFDVINSSSVVMFGVAAGGLATHRLIDATTNVISDALIIDHATSGTPAAGFGQQLRFRAQSSTTASRNVGLISTSWAVATDAARTGRGGLWASDATTDRECVRWESDGTNPMVGFLGAGAVVRQVGASAAGIAAVIDPNAAAALAALQSALAALGLVTSPA